MGITQSHLTIFPFCNGLHIEDVVFFYGFFGLDILYKIICGISGNSLSEITKHYHGTGCQKCLFTGYMGRIAVYEYLPITQNIKKLISRNAGEEELFTAARAEMIPYLFLLENALEKIQEGITTVDEVIAKVPMSHSKFFV